MSPAAGHATAVWVPVRQHRRRNAYGPPGCRLLEQLSTVAAAGSSTTIVQSPTQGSRRSARVPGPLIVAIQNIAWPGGVTATPARTPKVGVPAELKLVTVVYSTLAREPLTALMGLDADERLSRWGCQRPGTGRGWLARARCAGGHAQPVATAQQTVRPPSGVVLGVAWRGRRNVPRLPAARLVFRVRLGESHPCV